MKKISSLHKNWMKEPAYRKEYETQEDKKTSSRLHPR